MTQWFYRRANARFLVIDDTPTACTDLTTGLEVWIWIEMRRGLAGSLWHLGLSVLLFLLTWVKTAVNVYAHRLVQIPFHARDLPEHICCTLSACIMHFAWPCLCSSSFSLFWHCWLLLPVCLWNNSMSQSQKKQTFGWSRVFWDLRPKGRPQDFRTSEVYFLVRLCEWETSLVADLKRSTATWRSVFAVFGPYYSCHQQHQRTLSHR